MDQHFSAGDDFRESSRREKEERFFETLTKYFSSGPFSSWFFDGGAKKIESELENLNKNLKEASDSSTNLTRALNKLTFWGVLIAGVGVLVAVSGVILSLVQFLYENHIWPFTQ